ncbi:MAG: hypothetical protein JSS61_03300 [Verrucomicrobia bacterium]|nr:hypothetical protein [Verrucomicrobiota bacterium]
MKKSLMLVFLAPLISYASLYQYEEDGYCNEEYVEDSYTAAPMFSDEWDDEVALGEFSSPFEGYEYDEEYAEVIPSQPVEKASRKVPLRAQQQRGKERRQGAVASSPRKNPTAKPKAQAKDLRENPHRPRVTQRNHKSEPRANYENELQAESREQRKAPAQRQKQVSKAAPIAKNKELPNRAPRRQAAQRDTKVAASKKETASPERRTARVNKARPAPKAHSASKGHYSGKRPSND